MEITAWSPKGGRSREIKLNSEALKALHAVPRYLHSEFVFCNSDGTALRHNHGYKTLKSAAKRAGIPFPMGYHTLRHTFASHLAMYGVSLRTIQLLLGHQSIEMTERYAHLLPSVKEQAVNVLEAAFVEAVSDQNPLAVC